MLFPSTSTMHMNTHSFLFTHKTFQSAIVIMQVMFEAMPNYMFEAWP